MELFAFVAYQSIRSFAQQEGTQRYLEERFTFSMKSIGRTFILINSLFKNYVLIGERLHKLELHQLLTSFFFNL